MIGLIIAAVGWICVLAGLVLTVGPWALVGVGAVTVPVGLLFDWEATRGKRR